ncbi:MAG: hypothetical protein M1820_000613 [Bogoriella megaspora]|nr:MAG: hypothetical protein M1820_000613 [Bogoriella megaspora]
MQLISSLHGLITACLAATALAQSRTSPPSGALVVNPNATSGQYKTISSAVAKLSTSATSAQSIFIYPGTYKEQVSIPSLKGPLTIYGSTSNTQTYKSNTVTITNGAAAASGISDDQTGTLRAETSGGFKLYNVNLANSYGTGSQALALSSNAGNQGFYGCQFTGYQDTVLAQTGYSLFAKSLIVGNTDFIFGQHGQSWLDSVDIQVSNTNLGYVTASGRPSSTDPSYYVINNSTISGVSSSVPAGSHYLGRPWGAYARVAVQHTSLSNVINAAGWHVWNTGDERTDNVSFGEYGNTGAGASGTRASFATKLSAPVDIATVLGSGWESANYVDASYVS